MENFTKRYEKYGKQGKKVGNEEFFQDLKYSFISLIYTFVFLLKGSQEQFFQYTDSLENSIQQELLKKVWKLCQSDPRWSFNAKTQKEKRTE